MGQSRRVPVVFRVVLQGLAGILWCACKRRRITVCGDIQVMKIIETADTGVDGRRRRYKLRPVPGQQRRVWVRTGISTLTLNLNFYPRNPDHNPVATFKGRGDY